MHAGNLYFSRKSVTLPIYEKVEFNVCSRFPSIFFVPFSWNRMKFVVTLPRGEGKAADNFGSISVSTVRVTVPDSHQWAD